MKANRAFRNDEDAVSPVIAVILMVAVTVVLAATVYTWVSGFRGASASPAASLALSSNGSPANPGAGNFYKNFTITVAMAGMRYGDLQLTLEGVPLVADLGAACEPSATGRWTACGGPTVRGATSQVSAGDFLSIRATTTPTGKMLRFVDPESNSILLAATV